MAHTWILMVCLGNICRSPLAEGLLQSKLNSTKFKVDSAGTYGSHAGSQPDKRSMAVALKNGLDISSQRSRKFIIEDFNQFDIIYAMDDSNFKDLMSLTKTSEHQSKIRKMLDEAFPGESLEVPDPYHGGQRGFETVYKMLDRATSVVAEKLQNPTNQQDDL
jgi:protein-tyrosine phosphatase